MIIAYIAAVLFVLVAVTSVRAARRNISHDLEEMPQRKNGITLLYRSRTWADVVFREELEHLLAARGGVVHHIVGRRGREVHPHPFAPRALAQMVPDIRQRDVFVCGPRDLVDDVLASLGQLRVPPRQVHVERFAFLS